MRSLSMLQAAIRSVPEALLSIPDQAATEIPSPGKWSRKQELGHLLDSAANNHQRIVRAQLEMQPAMPGYDGDRWVDLHGYQRRDWKELIRIWSALNLQFVAAVEAAIPAASARTCTIGGSEPLTISFTVDDYVEHMFHHLQHIGVDLKHVSAVGE